MKAWTKRLPRRRIAVVMIDLVLVWLHVAKIGQRVADCEWGAGRRRSALAVVDTETGYVSVAATDCRNITSLLWQPAERFRSCRYFCIDGDPFEGKAWKAIEPSTCSSDSLEAENSLT
jgi:hypothetical protein